MIDLSIVIVSYNTRKLLEKCLQSLAEDIEMSQISAEVIVVDNGSNDGSLGMINKFRIRLIENKKNIGFGRANNQAVKIATGRYLLLLNSDTEIRPGALSKMMAFMQSHPEVGIASCQLKNPDRSIQPQGGFLPRLSTVAIWSLFIDDLPGFNQFLPSYQLRRKSFFVGQAKDIGWVGGTAMFIRNKVWKQLDGFDEHIFMYGEDVELCYRASLLGWKVMINPEAEIIHHSKASGGRWVTGEVEGLLYLFAKHKPKWEMPVLRFILKVGMGLRWWIFGILGGHEELKIDYKKAVDLVR